MIVLSIADCIVSKHNNSYLRDPPIVVIEIFVLLQTEIRPAGNRLNRP
jgi:hypothetical protein